MENRRLLIFEDFWSFGICEFKQDKLEARAVKCVFIGYPEGVKGYKLWNLKSGGGSKVFISRDVTFDETGMGMKCKDLETLVPETRVEETQFEVELPNEEKYDVEDEASTSDTSGTQSVVDPDYLLTGDRERRTITTPRRYGYADLVCFSLNATEDLQDSEPRDFKETFERKESKYWLKAVNEEMDSLEKTQTWKRVKLPKHQRVVGCKWIFKKRKVFRELKVLGTKQDLWPRVSLKWRGLTAMKSSHRW